MLDDLKGKSEWYIRLAIHYSIASSQHLVPSLYSILNNDRFIVYRRGGSCMFLFLGDAAAIYLLLWRSFARLDRRVDVASSLDVQRRRPYIAYYSNMGRPIDDRSCQRTRISYIFGCSWSSLIIPYPVWHKSHGKKSRTSRHPA